MRPFYFLWLILIFIYHILSIPYVFGIPYIPYVFVIKHDGQDDFQKMDHLFSLERSGGQCNDITQQIDVTI